MEQENLLHKNYRFDDNWSSTVMNVDSLQSDELSVKILKSSSDFFSMRDEWDRLTDCSSATIYQSFDWLYNWWEIFAKDLMFPLHIILIYFSGELVGICPFYIQTVSFSGFRIYQRLRFLGGGLSSGSSKSFSVEEIGLSDYLDIIVKTGFENLVANTLSTYFIESRYFYDEIDLQNVSEESVFFKSVVPALKRKNFDVNIVQSDTCPYIVLPADLDKFMKGLKPSARRKFKTVQKQLKNEELSCELKVVNKANFSDALHSLKVLHQQRWNLLGYQGLFYDERVEKFQIKLANELFEKNMVWFKLFKYKNKVIAARLIYRFKNIYYDYLSGFDSVSDVASLRPGLTLIFSMIEDAISNGLETVDLLRGAEQYKFEISNWAKNNYNILVKVPVQNSGAKLRIIKAVKAKRKILQRFHIELSVAEIHFKQHGLIKFLPAYLKFWQFRFKELLDKRRKNATESPNNNADEPSTNSISNDPTAFSHHSESEYLPPKKTDSKTDNKNQKERIKIQ